MKIWYQCYHSTKYPVISFEHVDNPEIIEDSIRNSSFHSSHPNANSTMIDSQQQSQNQTSLQPSSLPIDHSRRVFNQTLSEPHRECQSVECSSYNVGHISHIPRTPPSPATYTIPTMINQSMGVEKNEEDIFGMIKLGDNDVCYTSGTIEWVGRKRNFPINSGFKTLNPNQKDMNQPFTKKIKLNKTFTSGRNRIKECDCADVLPTVNAIVDHLNALHEAVDLVDLRLNTLEGVITRDD